MDIDPFNIRQTHTDTGEPGNFPETVEDPGDGERFGGKHCSLSGSTGLEEKQKNSPVF